MCNACGMNHFDDDDIDYDDEELLASLGIDDSNGSSNLSLSVSNQQTSASTFVAVNKKQNQAKGVLL
ncbi:hypothetical protein [Psychrobacter sp. I-STPA10]|uniref:hypothetical protein n=1 Tax=Psychrobacter sp. I-STPA10 TaxID=2585769 RepID=UPI001E5BFF55|nr:hypothetical protein [Psychrobacter sp. I-STPA10]